MGFFQWALLGIGIVIIVLLSMIVNHLEWSRYYLKCLSAQAGSCLEFLQAIEHNVLKIQEKIDNTEK